MEPRNRTRPTWAKKNAPLAAALALLFKGGVVCANPQGGQVVAGSAAIDQSDPNTSVITQQSDRAVINWQSFSIGTGETTRFVQPSASSVTLNRVTGGDPSQILGNLSANGNLFIINRNGVVFGTNARVDVGGLVVTTHDIDDNAFMAGDYRFTTPGRADASIVNLGQITIADAGLAAFVAPAVRNDGVIVARLGRIALASGNTFTLDLFGDKLIQLAVDPVTLRAIYPDGTPVSSLVENNGTIGAEGGTVLLTANAARDVVNNVINVTGMVSASSARVDGGNIILEGGNGNVQVTGTLDASSSAGNGGTIAINGNASLVNGNAQLLTTSATGSGGTIHLLGDRVGVAGNALLDASGATGGGTVLVGGDYHGDNAAIRNATFTWFGANAQIKADALQSGNGGKVVLWSNDTTHMLGTISARGGALNGNGGFVETSGKGYLDFLGSVDTTAANGTKGTLLLDPTNIIVGTTADITGTGGTTDIVTATDLASATSYGPVTSNITANALATLLNANSVTLAATNNIAINSAVNVTFGGTTQSLLLDANTIDISANIASNGGPLNLSLGAPGGVTLNNAAIALSGGTLISNGTLSATSGTLESVVLGSNLTLGSGSVLNVNNGLTLANGVSLDIGDSTLFFRGSATNGIFVPTGTATVLMSGGTLHSSGGVNLLLDSTLSTGLTVQGYGTLSSTIDIFGVSTTGWINNGTINANTAGQTLDIAGGNFANNAANLTATGGTLSISSDSFNQSGNITVTGGTVSIAPANAWSNMGAISVASGGTLNLDGTITEDAGGSITNNGGLINILGTLDINGTNTINLGATGTNVLTGTLKDTLGTGSISGASLTSNNGTLDNVTIDNTLAGIAGMTLTNGSTLNIYNRLTLGASSTPGMGNMLYIGNSTLTFRGNGSGIFSANTFGNSYLTLSGGTLHSAGTSNAIGGGATVQGYGTLSGNRWDNNGTINANTANQTLAITSSTFNNAGSAQGAEGGVLAIKPVTFLNTGNVTAMSGGSGLAATVNITPTNAWSADAVFSVAGGILNLGGTFTLTTGSFFNEVGDLNITGTFDLGNTTFDLATFGGMGLTSFSGTFRNGTLINTATNAPAGTAPVATLVSNNGTLDNVTLGTHLAISGDTNVRNTLSLASDFTANSTLTLLNGASVNTGTYTLTLNGGTLAGSGAINLNGGTLTGIVSSARATPTISSGVTVRGIGTLNGSGWINNGTIDADTTGGTLMLAADTLTNNGTLRASNGGALTLNPLNAFVNTGLLEIASGSVVNVRGKGFTNGATGVIAGFGTLDLGGTGYLLNNQGVIQIGGKGTTGTLTLNGSLAMAQGSTLVADIQGVNAGSTTDGYDTLLISGTATLDGTLTARVNYASTEAESFDIIVANNGVSGTFASLVAPSGYGTEYNSTTASVTSPAPAIPNEAIDQERYADNQEFHDGVNENPIETRSEGHGDSRDSQLTDAQSSAPPELDGPLLEALGELSNYSAEERAAFFNSLNPEQVVSDLKDAGHQDLANFLGDTAAGVPTTTRQLNKHLQESGIPAEQRSEWLGVFGQMRHVGMGNQLSSALSALRESPDAADEFDEGVAGGPIRLVSPRSVESRDGTITVSGRVESASKMIQLRLNGRWVYVDEQGNFTATLSLGAGRHTLMLEAKDPAGVSTTQSVEVVSHANGKARTEKQRRVALIIGVEAYDNAIPELETPISDAKAMQTTLESRFGFEARVLANPTKRDVLGAMKQLAGELSEQDQLLVYYAGHGYLMRDTGRGYWLPRDAETGSPRNWISNRDVARLFHATRAKQIMLISDSCYSGAFTREGIGATLRKNVSRDQRAVMAFSSGGEQPVWDGGGGNHSLFAAQLLKQLDGGGAKSGQELYKTIRNEVSKVSPQVPGYGAMVSAGYDLGADYALE